MFQITEWSKTRRSIYFAYDQLPEGTAVLLDKIGDGHLRYCVARNDMLDKIHNPRKRIINIINRKGKFLSLLSLQDEENN